MKNIKKLLIQIVAFPLKTFVRVFSTIGVFPKFTGSMVTAGQMGKAFRAYDNNDYETAFKILKPVADKEPDTIPDQASVGYAQYYIGLMYYHGRGIQENDSLGEHYFQKAASLGIPEAIEYLREIGKMPRLH